MVKTLFLSFTISAAARYEWSYNYNRCPAVEARLKCFNRDTHRFVDKQLCRRIPQPRHEPFKCADVVADGCDASSALKQKRILKDYDLSRFFIGRNRKKLNNLSHARVQCKQGYTNKMNQRLSVRCQSKTIAFSDSRLKAHRAGFKCFKKKYSPWSTCIASERYKSKGTRTRTCTNCHDSSHDETEACTLTYSETRKLESVCWRKVKHIRGDTEVYESSMEDAIDRCWKSLPGWYDSFLIRKANFSDSKYYCYWTGESVSDITDWEGFTVPLCPVKVKFTEVYA